MNTSSTITKTIEEIYTFACEPVHPAWVNEQTTPIATSMAVVQFSTGELIMIAPCEVQLAAEKYPSLGLEAKPCDSSALQWQAPSGRTLIMQPLAPAAAFLPFTMLSMEESDSLGEGCSSQFTFVRNDGATIVFRHIMPPMTLGIDLRYAGEAPN